MHSDEVFMRPQTRVIILFLFVFYFLVMGLYDLLNNRFFFIQIFFAVFFLWRGSMERKSALTTPYIRVTKDGIVFNHNFPDVTEKFLWSQIQGIEVRHSILYSLLDCCMTDFNGGRLYLKLKNGGELRIQTNQIGGGKLDYLLKVINERISANRAVE